YKVFDAIADALARHLGHAANDVLASLPARSLALLSQLFPSFAPLSSFDDAGAPFTRDNGREQRNEAFAALKHLLRRVAERWPLVLLVDDLQGGDADSARMLAHVLGPPAPPPLLLAGAYRVEDEASSDFLQHSLVKGEQPEFALTRIELGPLEPDEALE